MRTQLSLLARADHATRHPAPMCGIPPVRHDDYHQIFGQLLRGVCVVTAGQDEGRTGLATTSMVPLGTVPPRVMFAVAEGALCLPLIEREAAFGVNILSADQEEVAAQFSTRNGTGWPEGVNWTTRVTGVPLLADAVTAFECRADELLVRHGRVIIMGGVVGVMTLQTDRPALAWWRGRFEAFGWSEAEIERATNSW